MCASGPQNKRRFKPLWFCVIKAATSHIFQTCATTSGRIQRCGDKCHCREQEQPVAGKYSKTQLLFLSIPTPPLFASILSTLTEFFFSRLQSIPSSLSAHLRRARCRPCRTMRTSSQKKMPGSESKYRPACNVPCLHGKSSNSVSLS